MIYEYRENKVTARQSTRCSRVEEICEIKTRQGTVDFENILFSYLIKSLNTR